MKKFLITLAFLAAASVAVNAQTVSIPAASQPSVLLKWSLPTIPVGSLWGGCTASSPCTFQAYRIAGTCPATITGSAGWTALVPTGTNATAATDTTASGQVSYIVETVQGALNSAPSNCTTVTVPNVPSPVIVTAS